MEPHLENLGGQHQNPEQLPDLGPGSDPDSSWHPGSRSVSESLSQSSDYEDNTSRWINAICQVSDSNAANSRQESVALKEQDGQHQGGIIYETEDREASNNEETRDAIDLTRLAKDEGQFREFYEATDRELKSIHNTLKHIETQNEKSNHKDGEIQELKASIDHNLQEIRGLSTKCSESESQAELWSILPHIHCVYGGKVKKSVYRQRAIGIRMAECIAVASTTGLVLQPLPLSVPVQKLGFPGLAVISTMVSMATPLMVHGALASVSVTTHQIRRAGRITKRGIMTTRKYSARHLRRLSEYLEPGIEETSPHTSNGPHH